MQAFPFDIQNIAAAADKVPNLFDRVGQLVDFQDVRSPVTSVTLIRRDDEITLLDPVAREADRQELGGEEELGLTFSVPSRKLGGKLSPTDIQNVVAFAPGPNQLRQQAEAYNRILLRLRRPHDITFEHIRMGAVKGVITNPRTGAVMYNLFDEFAIPKKVITLDLTDENTNILEVTAEIADHIGQNLFGETASGIHALVRPGALTRLRTHPSYEKYILGHAAALEQLQASRATVDGANNRRSLFIDGITFESYSGKARNSRGEVVEFIEDGAGHVFPTGTTDMFLDVDVPANRMGETNTPPSEEIKMYPHELEQAKGWDIDTESNKIAFCQRPEALVELDILT